MGDIEVRSGAILGRYELLAPIAMGGMARVWAARLLGQGGFSKLVALKMILPELASDLEFQQMFFDEARIAAKIRHPNVCETFDIGDEEGTLFIAMEWVDGVSLLRLSRVEATEVAPGPSIPLKRPIGSRLAARIMADACAGLHAAHELVDDDGTPLDVVHRDISPHNLLVSANGSVKVTDFGVAKALRKSHATSTGQVKGKVAYMSPEQLMREPIDRRSDVFALGCVLYEITTGRRPFSGEGGAELAEAIISGNVIPPSTIEPTYSPELEAIITRALASNRDERFASADAMRLELEAYLSKGNPVGAPAVAELVKDRCSRDVERRRQQIRAACAQHPGASLIPPTPTPRRGIRPSPSSPSFEVEGTSSTITTTLNDGSSSLTSTLPLETGAPRSTRVLLARASIVVVAAALLGVGGWYAIGARSRPETSHAPPNRADGTSDTAPVTFPAVKRATSGTSAPPAAPGAHQPAGRVALRITPANATIFVDDVRLPEGVTSLERPLDGQVRRVLVRADRHDDYVEDIEATTPDVLDIVLSKRGAPRPPARPRSTAGGSPSSALPNPYE